MIRLAQRLAAKSEHRQHHHACIITRGGKIVAMGHNHRYLHAERDACDKLYPYSLKRVLMYYGDFPLTSPEWSGNNYTLYSFRFSKGGSIGNAKPCLNCQSMLRKLGITKVFYTNEQGELTKL